MRFGCNDSLCILLMKPQSAPRDFQKTPPNKRTFSTHYTSENERLIFSITFEDNQITKSKGIDETAETFKTEHLNKITLNDKEIIIATIEFNTCTRRMNYTVNDLAYIQDIQALDEKITALAEQYHTNDLEMYATVDEVNDVLLKNYIQKGDLTEAVDKTTIYTTNEVDDKFALKSEIHILPTDHVTTA